MSITREAPNRKKILYCQVELLAKNKITDKLHLKLALYSAQSWTIIAGGQTFREDLKCRS